MVLNEDYGEVELEEELMNWVYKWLVDFYLLNFPIHKIPVEFFKEHNCGILFKSPEEIKDILIKHQDLRKENIKNMVLECFNKSESRRFIPLKTRDADFIFELNLKRLDDVKAEEYY